MKSNGDIYISLAFLAEGVNGFTHWLWVRMGRRKVWESLWVVKTVDILREKVGCIHSNRRKSGKIPEKDKEIKDQENRIARDSTREMKTLRKVSGTS